jgi:hypothetical protein
MRGVFAKIIIATGYRKIYIQQKTFAIAKKKANQGKGES